MPSYPATHMQHAAAILNERSKRQRRKVGREQRRVIAPEMLKTVTMWSIAENRWCDPVTEPTSRDDRPTPILSSHSWVEVPAKALYTDRRKTRSNMSFNDSVVARHDYSQTTGIMSRSAEIKPAVQRDYSPNYTKDS